MNELVQINAGPLEFGGQGLATTHRGYYVYMTEACNLRCNYCFVDGKKNDRHLFDPLNYPREAGKPDMVGQVLDFIVDDPEGQDSKYIHFFGGEPLIRAKSVARMCEELKRRISEKYPKCKLTLGITTNGTLLTDENCEMLKKYGVGVQLSLDGSEEGNDVHRQLMGGDQDGLKPSGAFKLVKIQNYLKHFGSNARMTVTPQNLSFLIQSIRDLTALGFKSFSVIPNSDAGKWDGLWMAYESVLEDLFELAMITGITVNIVDQTFRKIESPKVPDHLCRSGRNVIGISVDGDIWPCHDFLGRFQYDSIAESLQIGHISKGYTVNTQKFEDLKVTEEVTSGAGYDCTRCHASGVCERGCPYVNFTSHNDIRTVNATYCQSTRLAVDVALRYMLKHPEKFVVGKRTNVEEDRTSVIVKVFEKTAPYGRNPQGRALLPGPGRMRDLGLEPCSRLSVGSGSQPSGGQGSAEVKPINGFREPQKAPLDGEQALPSTDGFGPAGGTMHMVPKPIPGLEARQ